MAVWCTDLYGYVQSFCILHTFICTETGILHADHSGFDAEIQTTAKLERRTDKYSVFLKFLVFPEKVRRPKPLKQTAPAISFLLIRLVLLAQNLLFLAACFAFRKARCVGGNLFCKKGSPPSPFPKNFTSQTALLFSDCPRSTFPSRSAEYLRREWFSAISSCVRASFADSGKVFPGHLSYI